MRQSPQLHDRTPVEAATVLLVDDEPDLLEEMAEVLENAGYPCLTADNANQAYEIIRQDDNVGLVVTDIRMPGLDGLEFIREMKNKSRREQNLAMVVLSGHAGFDEAVRAMRAGAEDFLTKPASPDDLLGAIERALSLTTLRRTESQFREGLASQSEEKARTITQIQETLRSKNQYIESLENSCQFALNHGRHLSEIAREITASLTQQMRSLTQGADGYEASLRALNNGIDTLQICASLGAEIAAIDVILGRTTLATHAKALKLAVDGLFSRQGLILEIDTEQDERQSGIGSLVFFGGVCAALVSAADRAEPGSRIILHLGWQGHRLGAAISFRGQSCSDDEKSFIEEPRMTRTYSSLLNPSLYIARRLLDEGLITISFKEGVDEHHCFDITARKSVS